MFRLDDWIMEGYLSCTPDKRQNMSNLRQDLEIPASK